jgi:hypothetical protein
VNYSAPRSSISCPELRQSLEVTLDCGRTISLTKTGSEIYLTTRLLCGRNLAPASIRHTKRAVPLSLFVTFEFLPRCNIDIGHPFAAHAV